MGQWSSYSGYGGGGGSKNAGNDKEAVRGGGPTTGSVGDGANGYVKMWRVE